MQCVAPLFSPDSDTFVARVVAIGKTGTYKQPPEAYLRVEQVLSGSRPRGNVTATWRPIDPFWCPVGEEANIARWEAQPLATPSVGSRVLLTGFQEPSGYVVNASCAVFPSRTVIERVQQRKAEWRRREDLDRRSKRERQKADAQQQAQANLASLRDSAEIIVRFTDSDAWWHGDVAVLLLRGLIWEKGAPRHPGVKSIYVQISGIDYQLLIRRISGLGEKHYLAFLREIPEIDARYLPECPGRYEIAPDPRHFTLVDKRVGILTETPAVRRYFDAAVKSREGARTSDAEIATPP